MGDEKTDSSKHIAIDMQLHTLRGAIDNFENFVATLRSDPKALSEGIPEERAKPSFIEVINTAPEQIAKCANRVDDLQKELSEMLF